MRQRILIGHSDIKSLRFNYNINYVIKALYQGKLQNYNLPCGSGRSIMELEWAHQVNKVTRKPVILISSSSNHNFFKALAEHVEIGVTFPTNAEDIKGINIINYEKLNRFDPETFVGIACEVGSLLGDRISKNKKIVLEPFFAKPKYHFLTAPNNTRGILWLQKVLKNNE
jgi:hypothetical protein